MIQPNELRIGNLVERHGEICLIKTISNVGIYGVTPIKMFGIISSAHNEITPIPITEEWLLKGGFKKWGIDDAPRTISYEHPDIHIFPSNVFCDFKGYGFIHYKPEGGQSMESARFKMEYIHQLQNLFLSLTGKELEFKL